MQTFPAATTSMRHRDSAKLLRISFTDSSAISIRYLRQNRLTEQFQSGDLLVVNAAATLPASFTGIHQESRQKIEIRLVRQIHPERSNYFDWQAIVLGDGNWELPTEERTDIPALCAGETLLFDAGLKAYIVDLSPMDDRFLTIRFIAPSDAILHQLYAAGRLIQYSYHEQELDLWDGQTIFASRPLALEAPSAAFFLTWKEVNALMKRGVEITSLNHAAGISSTGSSQLDALLPLPEYYDIPKRCAELVNRAHLEGRRVIALGTSVTRALESAVDPAGGVTVGDGTATLVIDSSYQRKIVTGLLTGLHESHTSHLSLLENFVARTEIETAYRGALDRGFLWHEYGDICMIA